MTFRIGGGRLVTVSDRQIEMARAYGNPRDSELTRWLVEKAEAGELEQTTGRGLPAHEFHVVKAILRGEVVPVGDGVAVVEQTVTADVGDRDECLCCPGRHVFAVGGPRELGEWVRARIMARYPAVDGMRVRVTFEILEDGTAPPPVERGDPDGR